MNNATVIKLVSYFFIYLIIQVFLAKNLIILGLAFCFVYVGYLLILPLDIDKALFIIIGFILGFVVDNFYDTLGFHSSACVLLAFIRPYMINLMREKEMQYISIHQTSWTWFSTYALPLIFLHHTIIFFIEIASVKMFLLTMLKVIVSTLFTFSLVIISQYLFVSSKN